jgi:hypothetical protein
MMRLLDVYCGAGGAGMGYRRAGFEIVGVDNEPQPDYPGAFRLGDALAVLADTEFLAGFDAIHASPPCQASSALTKGTNAGRVYPQLIPSTRELLNASGLPYVIENVQGAAVRRDLTLCGEMFTLAVIRHRYFEISGFTAVQPVHQPHRGRVSGWRHGVFYPGPYVAVETWREAMGIDWTWNRKSIAEAIPPVYTQFVGGYLAQSLAAAA